MARKARSLSGRISPAALARCSAVSWSAWIARMYPAWLSGAAISDSVEDAEQIGALPEIGGERQEDAPSRSRNSPRRPAVALLEGGDEIGALRGDQFGEQLLVGVEIGVERALRDAGRLGDAGHRGFLVAVTGDDAERCLEQRLARAARVLDPRCASAGERCSTMLFRRSAPDLVAEDVLPDLAGDGVWQGLDDLKSFRKFLPRQAARLEMRGHVVEAKSARRRGA